MKLDKSKIFIIIDKIEIGSFFIFLLGILFYTLKLPYTKLVLITGIGLLCVSSYYQSFKKVIINKSELSNKLGKEGFIQFIYKLYFITLSFTPIIFFNLFSNLFPIEKFIKFISILLIIITIISKFSKFEEKQNLFNFKYYFRIVICFVLMFFLAKEKGLF